MYYSPKKSRNSRFGRGARTFQGSNNRNKTGRTIDPAKYVQKAEPIVEQVVYEPTNQFEDFAIDQQLKANIRKAGYTTPTAIQDQSIEAILAGKDLVGTAQTGTGKTAAFLLPLINKLMRFPQERVLIIVPTRELANQIDEELRKFAGGMKVYSAICIGGANIQRQIQQLRRHPQFVIGTPGRLKDLHNRKALSLNTFTAIVLDEVDRMLDMGFIHDIKFIASHIPAKRQTLFFSATLGGDVKTVMDSFLNEPVFVHISSNTSGKNIEQDIIKITGGQKKQDVLHDLLSQEEFEKVLVFSRTKHGADKIATLLEKRGHKVDAIHGNKTQGKRERTLRDFKTDKINVLIATDVAARGIDINGVSHVINYDEPENYQDYIHRIGRTGRAGKTGKALTFVQR